MFAKNDYYFSFHYLIHWVDFKENSACSIFYYENCAKWDENAQNKRKLHKIFR